MVSPGQNLVSSIAASNDCPWTLSSSPRSAVMRFRITLAVLLLSLFGPEVAWGQETQELPPPARPVKALDAGQLAGRQARALYGLAMLRLHGDRLIEAARLLEEAEKLEPRAPAIPRALAALYATLGREA